jgi:DNA-binding CsgD family transcriptional regulator
MHYREIAVSDPMEDALNEINAANNIVELQPIIDRIGQRIGFTCSSYVDARKLPIGNEAPPYHVTTVKQEFIHAYIEQGLLGYDPIAIRAATTNSPFTWTDCGEYREALKPQRGVKGRVARLAGLAHDYGFQQGYVVPCHAVDANGRLASAFTSFYWPGKPEELTEKAALVPMWLRLATAFYHERSLALRADETAQQSVPKLTDRERECLVWACRGKTRGETADLLNVGDRTVEYHLANAMKKLGVYNKFHAIAVAIHLGIVSP